MIDGPPPSDRRVDRRGRRCAARRCCRRRSTAPLWRRRCWSTRRRRPGLPRRGLRPDRGALRVRRLRRALREVNDSRLRPAGRHLHERPRRTPGGVRGLEVGSVIVNDVPDLPRRQHALRRRQGLRLRPRGPPLGDRGHDRAAHARHGRKGASADASRRRDRGLVRADRGRPSTSATPAVRSGRSWTL